MSFRDDTGASAVEYSLLAAAIAAVLVIVLFAFGGTVSSLFTGSCEQVRSKAAPTETC